MTVGGGWGHWGKGTVLYLSVSVGLMHLYPCAGLTHLLAYLNTSFTTKDFKALIDLAKKRKGRGRMTRREWKFMSVHN